MRLKVEKKKFIFIGVALLVAGILAVVLLYDGEEKNYRSDFCDYFDARALTNPPNNELQEYDTSYVSLEDSRINITADKVDGKYYSGKAESFYAFRYGSFTFRVNTLSGNGLFPAIWMLPADGNVYPEVDIYELLGDRPGEMHGVMHYVENGVKERSFHTYSFDGGKIPKSYEIRFEWSPSEMVWYLDGSQIFKITEHVPAIPMYMIVNLAVGGDWPGNPDANTKFPSRFNVEIIDFSPRETYRR